MCSPPAPIRALFSLFVTVCFAPICFAAAHQVSAAEAAGAHDAAAGAEITATGTAELRVPPTKVSFSIGVTTDAASSAQASAENARTYQAVEGALRRVGLTRPEVVGSQLTVFPRWEYDEASHRQRRAGFEATHTMKIETTRLDRLGVYIDAATGAGASSVSDIDFSVDNPAAARHEALAQAVQNARGDAEAMARAAGGALGGLVQLSTEQPGVMPGVALAEVRVSGQRALPESVATTVTPSEIQVTAHVVARWTFVPSRP